uniref:Uncharacterized protein n=1 Tax=Knipowitschia caucasica TaxID=637954 RepID=A0AAV2L9K3_KNICA
MDEPNYSLALKRSEAECSLLQAHFDPEHVLPSCSDPGHQTLQLLRALRPHAPHLFLLHRLPKAIAE